MTNIQIPAAFSEIFKPYRVKTFFGGRGSGKSENIGRYLLASGSQKKQNIICGREFQSSIKESVHSMLEHLIHNMKLETFYDVFNNEIRGKNGTQFSFVGVRNNVQNIKSMHDINKFWGEEAQSFSQNSLDIIFPTIRAKGSELLFTMNPILVEDPAYQTLIANPQPDSLVREVNYMDNPFFPPELEQLRLHHKAKYPEEKYNNIWLGQCLSAVEGAIFARELEQATKEGRITKVPYDPRYPVHTFWDLGHSDQTAIWFIQIVGFEYRIIHYYANSQEKMHHYIHYIQEQKYNYGTHYLPHDADHEQLGQEATIVEQAEEALVSVEIVPRVRLKAHAIDQARLVMPMCYWDNGCADGLSALRRHAFSINEETGRISKDPEHKIWSHGCLIAGTKILTRTGEVNIEDIETGDYVWTPSGYSEVLNSGQTKVSTKLIKIKTNSSEIQATPEHKFFTDRGVVRADALMYNDVIWSKTNHLPLNSEESHIGYRDDIMSLHQVCGKVIPNIKTYQNTVQVVVEVKEEEKNLPVYDLTVEKHHCYLANGMIVSNSDAFMTFGTAIAEGMVASAFNSPIIPQSSPQYSDGRLDRPKPRLG